MAYGMDSNAALASLSQLSQQAQGFSTTDIKPPPPITVASHLTRLKTIVERLNASAGQAEASADNLISNAKMTSSAGQTAAPEPSGLLDQMGNALTAAELRLDRLGHALDRIDRAHG